jgi:hypothetical protein
VGVLGKLSKVLIKRVNVFDYDRTPVLFPRGCTQVSGCERLRQISGSRVRCGSRDGRDYAKEMNRTLLYALRKVERKTTLRAEWTSGDNTTQRIFDYVLKWTIRS